MPELFEKRSLCEIAESRAIKGAANQRLLLPRQPTSLMINQHFSLLLKFFVLKKTKENLFILLSELKFAGHVKPTPRAAKSGLGEQIPHRHSQLQLSLGPAAGGSSSGLAQIAPRQTPASAELVPPKRPLPVGSGHQGRAASAVDQDNIEFNGHAEQADGEGD